MNCRYPGVEYGLNLSFCDVPSKQDTYRRSIPYHPDRPVYLDSALTAEARSEM